MSQAATVDKEVPNPKAKGGALATMEDTAKFEELLQVRNISKQQFQVMRDVIHPNAENPMSILLAFDYCKARNLDPFKRGVHIVPVWSKKAGKMVDTIWQGISETRTTAMRTGQYAGCDSAEFGPTIEHTFSNKQILQIPEWCQITVYRNIDGQRFAFPGPKVRWLEEYATVKHDSDIPNSMWMTRIFGQLEKVAESAALKKAFPEECESTAEEMEGQTLEDSVTVTKKEQQEMVKQVAQEMAQAATESDVVDAEPVEDKPEAKEVEPTSQEKRAAAARVAEATGEPQSVVDSLNTNLKGITSSQQVALMKFGKEKGWVVKNILDLITAPPYSVNASTWNAELTERQLLQVREHIEKNPITPG